MIRYAAKTLCPAGEDGAPQTGRRIDLGDKCTVGTKGRLWPVSYPVSGGVRAAYLPDLCGLAAVYNQFDYPNVPYPGPGRPDATVKSGGCGPTSMAMVVETLCPGVSFAPAAAAAYARSAGARAPSGTDMGVLSKRAAEKFRLTLSVTSAISALLAHLRAGGIAVANVAGNGMFSTGGHYLVVLAEQDGLLTIADPGLYSGKYASAKRRAAVKVVGKLLRAAPETLDKDCAGRNPRYYLFL